ncbi:histidinol phosphate phosphatase [uncultured Clostridium sp.]|uniref:histidinol phosphate phosphatase n=1 Tax=uncultured Clostridium sp. TaxID=59620 RepID=UPI002582BF7B|nr:histidinol phosphate phosphatase [uncultured Clostridium sp.]
MIFDSHMHSQFSTDSIMKIEDAINTAKEKNIGIIITDHMDLDYPIKDKFRFDVPSYFNEYEKYRSANLKLGIEIGLAESTFIDNEKIASSYDFDFILGSIHSVKGLDIYTYLLHESSDKNVFLSSYFEDMLKCVQLYDNFDSLSHIDYPSRYFKIQDKEIILKDFKDIIAEVFKTLIIKNKVLELNTSRLHIKEAQDSLLDIYKLYTDLGGKHVTLGSDAHIQNSIAKNFDIALSFLENLNLQGVYFNKRQLEIISNN